MDYFNLDRLVKQWQATLDPGGTNLRRYEMLCDEICRDSRVRLSDRDGEALKAQGWALSMLPGTTNKWAWIGPNGDQHDCRVCDGGATIVSASTTWIAACAVYRQFGDLVKTVSKSTDFKSSIWANGKHGRPWHARSLMAMMRDVWPRDTSMQSAHTTMVSDWENETVPDESLHRCTPYSYEAYIRLPPLPPCHQNSFPECSSVATRAFTGQSLRNLAENPFPDSEVADKINKHLLKALC